MFVRAPESNSKNESGSSERSGVETITELQAKIKSLVQDGKFLCNDALIISLCAIAEGDASLQMPVYHQVKKRPQSPTSSDTVTPASPEYDSGKESIDTFSASSSSDASSRSLSLSQKTDSGVDQIDIDDVTLPDLKVNTHIDLA